MRRARRHLCRMCVRTSANSDKGKKRQAAHTTHIVETGDISLTQDKCLVCVLEGVVQLYEVVSASVCFSVLFMHN